MPTLPQGPTGASSSTATGSTAAGDLSTGPDQNALLLVVPPGDKVVQPGQEASFELPAGTFRQTDPTVTTRLEATQADGRPLPDWITFDPTTGSFTSKPPADAPPSVEVKIVARDSNNNTAAASFQITVAQTPGQPTVPGTPTVQANQGVPSTGDAPPATGQPQAGTGSVTPTVIAAPPSSPLVVREPATNADTVLVLRLDPPPQEAMINKLSTFQLPQGIFASTKTDTQVAIEATLSSGSPLPSWLSFDPATGTFTGTPPEGTAPTIEIKLIARDTEGNEVDATFTLRINPPEEQAAALLTPSEELIELLANQVADEVEDTEAPLLPAGRASLADQFARHGKQGRDVQRQQMVHLLQKGFAARRG